MPKQVFKNSMKKREDEEVWKNQQQGVLIDEENETTTRTPVTAIKRKQRKLYE